MVVLCSLGYKSLYTSFFLGIIMNLREIILAAVMAMSTPVAYANPQTTQTIEQDGEQKPRRKRTELGLALKYGYSSHDSLAFEERRASLEIDRYLIEIGFRKEITERVEDDDLSIAGINMEGKRRFQTFQANITFGYIPIDFETPYLEIGVAGQVMGGIQLNKNVLRVSGESIPGDPDLDFLLGSGVRLEFSHPLAYWTKWPFLRNLEVGIGVFGEYLAEQVDIMEPESGIYAGTYGLVKIGRKVK